MIQIGTMGVVLATASSLIASDASPPGSDRTATKAGYIYIGMPYSEAMASLRDGGGRRLVSPFLGEQTDKYSDPPQRDVWGLPDGTTVEITSPSCHGRLTSIAVDPYGKWKRVQRLAVSDHTLQQQ